MTKAERIFNKTLQDCRIFLRHHPEEDGSVGYNSMSMEDTDSIYTRTANEIWKLIEAEKRTVSAFKRAGCDVELREKAIRMVENTMNNQYIVK